MLQIFRIIHVMNMTSFVCVFVCLVVCFLIFPFVLKESCIINKADQSVPLALDEKFNEAVSLVISFFNTSS